MAAEVFELYAEGLVKIALLDEGAFQELRTVLENAPPSKFGPKIVSELAEKISLIPKEDGREIIFTVIGSSLSRGGLTVERLADAITEDLEEEFEEAELSDKTIERLKQRLITLFNLSPIKVGGKSFELLIENANNFNSARVITDIRPVFDDEIEGAPKAAVILHALRITYTRNIDDKEFFVSLEDDDLQEFIDVLERAKMKANSLKSWLSASNVTHIEE